MPDRRVERTKRMLQEALIDLILQKGYEGITIKEIAEHANVNHATFYLHYKNKEHILEITLRETYEALVHELANDKRCCVDSKQAMIQIFHHVAAHAQIYRVLLSVSGGVNSAIIQTRNYIASLVQGQLINLAPHQVGAIPYDVIAHHTAGALLAVISWWLEHEMPYSPTVMGEMSCQLSSPPTLIGLGLAFQVSN
ncbi:MAG: TetR/AcrR family transcriptional regulator [Chloroflexi bacterium]|nr:TetR/AcrR family transcriptional regulator [Chloroflexota bacterium]